MALNTAPVVDITNTTLYPEPTNAATNYRNQSTSQFGVITNYINADIVNKLNSVADGSSGADNIKMTPITEVGAANTVQSVVEGLLTYATNTFPTITNTYTKTEVNSIATNFTLGAIADNSLTEAKMSAEMKKQTGGVAAFDTVAAHTPTKASASVLGHVKVNGTTVLADGDGVLSLDTSIAKFKAGTSTYTDNDTAQTFTDAFCTTASLVTVAITSVTLPQGTWSVESGAGTFTITSTVAESADITFDYYITKVV